MMHHVGQADVSKVSVQICNLTCSCNMFCPFLFEHTQTNRQFQLLCTNPSNTKSHIDEFKTILLHAVDDEKVKRLFSANMNYLKMGR